MSEDPRTRVSPGGKHVHGRPPERPKPLRDLEAAWDPAERLWRVPMHPPRWRLTSESFLEGEGLRLSSLWGDDIREEGVQVHAVWLPPAGVDGIHLVTGLSAEDPKLSTLLPIVPAALYFEREVAEMFGVEFVASPDRRPLLLHETHPSPPMRRGGGLSRPSGVRTPFTFPEVSGEGVYEIPVGPVHAGVIEPGHFRFQAMGEEILSLEVRLGYTHKGTERLFAGREPAHAVHLAESVAGDTPVAGACAYLEAVEAALELQADEAALAARGLLLEVERAGFLLGDMAGISLDVGYAAGAARANILREVAYDALDSLTGARSGRGILTVGGLLRPLDGSRETHLRGQIEHMDAGTKSLLQHLLSQPSVADRLRGTGHIARKVALSLSLVGPVARASGIVHDVRSDRPYGPYLHRPVHVAHGEGGDVESRLLVKAHEIVEACRLARTFLDAGALRAGAAGPGPASEDRAGRHGLGMVESPRGEYLTWISIGGDGNLQRVHIRDPSFLNWPAIEYAVRGNIVPDFPLCNKSLNLSYSGFDR